MNLSISQKDFYKRIYKIKKYKFVKKNLKKYKQHGKTTVYEHSRNVAYRSYCLAKWLEKRYNIKFNYDNLVGGAFLHDFCLYDWHEKNKSHKWHGFKHPKIAAKNAKKYCEANEEELKIIKTHMWPLTITKMPKSKEAFIVSAVDKYCAIKETIHRKEK